VQLSKSDQTRERILAAATEEFATYGIAGARVDRIAGAARANKSLIYSYFGDKEQLFDTVLQRQLSDLFRHIHITPDDLPGYAVELFDFASDHPQLMRLSMWHGLEQGRAWPLAEEARFDKQIAAIRDAQARGIVNASYPPDFLLTMIITMASAWTAANPFGMSITPDAQHRRALLRIALAQAVESVSRPTRQGEQG